MRLSPCTFTGKPTGSVATGRARLLVGSEAERARRALARQFPVLHGFLVPIVHRVKGYTTLHYALHLE